MGASNLILKQWTPSFSQEMDSVSQVPAWVLFPDLDPFLWSGKVLSKMASTIGKPLFVDLPTTFKSKLLFARVLVEVDVAEDLPSTIQVVTPYHGTITQRIVYEWLPYYCHCCRKLGHTKEHCKFTKINKQLEEKRKAKVVQEYRAVSQKITTPPSTDDSQGVGHSLPASGIEKPAGEEGKSPECTGLGSSLSNSEVLSSSVSKEAGSGSHIVADEGENMQRGEGKIADGEISVNPNYSVSVQNSYSILQEEGPILVTNTEDLGVLDIRRVTLVSSYVHDQLIHLELQHNASNKTFHVSFVYGSNDADHRERLWVELKGVASKVTNWILMGDWNIVRSMEERIGPNPPSVRDMLAFNQCILECQLEDLHSLGCEYTWTNKQEAVTRVWSRLDRVLSNLLWLIHFPTTQVHVLPAGVSDHSPLLVNVTDVPPPPPQGKDSVT
ncbi:uncharacterized protein LOC141614528 [Silene latifolia]|uniref:uncharacterized protein LOC141614528 n=1 Tax=Silene latifolia TaxID=37657 RepID=UPI003D780D93